METQGVCVDENVLSLNFILALTFISMLLIIIVSDFSYMIIPDEILIFFGVLLLIEIFVLSGIRTLFITILNGFIAFVFMFLLKLFGDFIFKRESLGGGDIKLMALFGVVLGWENAIVSIFLASLIGLPISLILLIRNKDNVVPFGPFLSIAAIILFLTSFDILNFFQVFTNI